MHVAMTSSGTPEDSGIYPLSLDLSRAQVGARSSVYLSFRELFFAFCVIMSSLFIPPPHLLLTGKCADEQKNKVDPRGVGSLRKKWPMLSKTSV